MRQIYFYLFLLLDNFCYSNTNSINNNNNTTIFLWLVIFIVLSRGFSIVKKVGIPLVVGEIFAGVIIGGLDKIGINLFQGAVDNSIIKFLAELGAIVLMFEIGLESKFSDLRRNFKSGIKLAISGTLFTFSAGFLVAKFLIPNSNLQLELLLGVIAAATATGISAKTFKDMNILKAREVKITLVGSIIDELISIFCFAIISGMLIDKALNLSTLTLTFGQLLAFFALAFIFGYWIVPFITQFSTKIHAGINMKIGVLFSICLLFAWGAQALGLATVIGSFIAGLILDQVYFKTFSKSSFLRQLRVIGYKIKDDKLKINLHQLIDSQEEKTLEELLKPLSHLFVPVFFIYIGLLLNFKTFFQFNSLMLTLCLVVLCFLGRIISGFLIKGKNLNKIIIGLGMTPIGEAGLIFAMFGNNLGIIDNIVLSSVVTSVVITAIATPILIKFAIKYKGICNE